MGLQNLHQEAPYLFIGNLERPCTAAELAGKMTEALSYPVRCYGDEQRLIHTLAIAGGAYDEGWDQASACGAQALLTGEVRHHNALTAVMSGFVLFDGGHFATEAPLVRNLSEYLQNAVNDVQYNVRVLYSTQGCFYKL